MSKRRLADLSLLAVAFMWGTTFLIVQDAVRALPPLTFNAIRFIGAALLLLLIILVFYKQEHRSINRAMLGHGLLLGLLLFAGYGLQTMGLLYTTTSNAGFITGLSVVLVPLLSLSLQRGGRGKGFWVSSVVAAAGLYLLTFSGGHMSLNRGDVLVLLCAVAFALHIVVTGRVAPRYSALPLAAIQLGATGLFSLAASLVFEPTAMQGLAQTVQRPEVLCALLISMGPTSAFAFWLQTFAQKHTTPVRVAVIFTMEPVFAAATGVLFADEHLGILAVLGCLLILGGMLLSELLPSASAEPAAEPAPAGKVPMPPAPVQTFHPQEDTIITKIRP